MLRGAPEQIGSRLIATLSRSWLTAVISAELFVKNG
jgi:hypothetical protein